MNGWFKTGQDDAPMSTYTTQKSYGSVETIPIQSLPSPVTRLNVRSRAWSLQFTGTEHLDGEESHFSDGVRYADTSMTPWRLLQCMQSKSLVRDYKDFVTPTQLDEINALRQLSSNIYFDKDYKQLIGTLWDAAFPAIPYDFQPHSNWEEIGFMTDDPQENFRASGRLGLLMLLYFIEYHNPDFKRIVQERRLPFCMAGLNVLEMLVIHLQLRHASGATRASICPCCGITSSAMQEYPSNREELRMFAELLNGENQRISHWSVPTAFCFIFVRALLFVEEQWCARTAYNVNGASISDLNEIIASAKNMICNILCQKPTVNEIMTKEVQESGWWCGRKTN